MNIKNIFGFKIGKSEESPKMTLPSFVPPNDEDGAFTVTSAAQFGTTSLEMDGTAKNEIELITRYREIAMQPEVESAIDDIVNEAIVHDDSGKSIEIVMDNLKQPDKIKKAIEEEFKNILRLLNFDNIGSDVFRRFYIDGRLFYHIVIDVENPHEGIQELRYIDPRKIRKIREVNKNKTNSGAELINTAKEYYIYSEKALSSSMSTTTVSSIQGIPIATDSIININSGLMDAKRGMVLSFLHKCIKPLNQLRMLEDAVVIYRLARSAERRVFYIDVGNLPKMKAEQHVKDVMTKYRNKLVYNSTTGQLQSDYRHMSMIEDYWMPRRCIALNTKIKLFNGNILTLEEIIKEYKAGKTLWAYSISPSGVISPGIISWAGITQRNASVLNVLLDNETFVTCTPDHKFILSDNRICEAQYLTPGTSLKTHLSTVKVIGIEHISDPMDTGTITIDEYHKLHDYHNFLLECGIFIKNSDGKATEITTLPSGGSLGVLDDISYFEKKLYKSLNVPVTRLDPSMATSVGRSTEITRDELKFSKFIDKQRHIFSELFDQALRVQLVLKGICTDDEWKIFKEFIYFDYLKDNNFAELKEAELIQERLSLLSIADQYSSKYYSREWINKNILQLTELEVEEMEKQIESNRKDDFKRQMEDQQRQLMLQQQAMEFQQQMNPQQPIDASDTGTGQGNTNNPYLSGGR